MKCRTLYFVYMKRMAGMFLAAFFMDLLLLESSLLPVLYDKKEFLRIKGEYIGTKLRYIEVSNLLFLLTAVWFCFAMLLFLQSTRGKGKDEFIYAFPITKPELLRVFMWVSTSLACGLSLIAEVLLVMRTSELGRGWEIVLGYLVKLTLLLLMGSLLLWLHSRGDFTARRMLKLTGLGLSGVILLYGVLKLGQMLLPYRGNHPYAMLQNLWRGLTYPRVYFQHFAGGYNYHGIDSLFLGASSATKVFAGIITLLLMGLGIFCFYREAVKYTHNLQVEKRQQVTFSLRQKRICLCLYLACLGGSISLFSFSIYERPLMRYDATLDESEELYCNHKGFLDFYGGEGIAVSDEEVRASDVMPGKFWLAARMCSTYTYNGMMDRNMAPIIYNFIDSSVTTNYVRGICVFMLLVFPVAGLLGSRLFNRRKERRGEA